MRAFRLIAPGAHYEEGHKYTEGEVVHSRGNLEKMFPGKFQPVEEAAGYPEYSRIHPPPDADSEHTQESAEGERSQEWPPKKSAYSKPQKTAKGTQARKRLRKKSS